MPYIDPEVILEAKKMDLMTYLQNYEPQELVHFSGNVYCTRTHDSLKISNGKWCWHSRGIGGRSALDYLIKVKGMNFTDAVEQIMGRAAIKPPVFMSTPKPQKSIPFVLPKQDRSLSMVESYLHKRGISYDLIHQCTDCELVYQNYRNGYYNIVFVGYDREKVPRYATVRGIDSDFSGDVSGSNKNYSFAISHKSQHLHLFESAIDLLSFATLEKDTSHAHDNLLSLSGVYKPKKKIEDSTLPLALTQFLTDHPDIQHIHLHLDNDIAGCLATKAIMTALPKQYKVTNEPPPSGKDYNDYLCDRLGLSRYQSKERSFAR